MIRNYSDFILALLDAGFSMGGGDPNGIYAVIPWHWNELPPYETPVRWYTGDPDTDPWEWRMRVVEERGDIAYAKLFFRKSGYISSEWYPYFLAARRKGKDIEDGYTDGNVSRQGKKIYDVISGCGRAAFHRIKNLADFKRGENSAFERALTELQTKMYITICGRQRKISMQGTGYGWSSTVFCTTENFFGKEVFEKASHITEKEAILKIKEQVYRLNPAADEKRVMRFIKG